MPRMRKHIDRLNFSHLVPVPDKKQQISCLRRAFLFVHENFSVRMIQVAIKPFRRGGLNI